MTTKRLPPFFGKIALFSAIVGGCLLTTTSSASPIAPGFDFFTSNDEFGDSLGAAVDLSAFGLGIIDLKGAPFPFPLFPLPPGSGIDTIVQRLDSVDPFDPLGAPQTIDIELVALHLTSIDPIDLSPLGGPFIGVFSDLHTTINKYGLIPGLPQYDILPSSIGKMEIRHEFGPLPTDDFGGTFDSIFGSPGDLNVPLDLQGLLVPGGGIFADAIFTVVGGDPSNPLDVFVSTPAPRLTIWSEDSTWEHTPFTDFQVTGIDHDCSFPECHPVEPITIVPEPTSLALLALGGLLFASRRRQTR